MPDLRDELLLQLAKQLTGNPSVASAERGWVLLHLALCAFPPSEELENHLELWLRERGAVACVWAMHLTLYRGGPARGMPPGVADIQASLERARAPALPSLMVPGAEEQQTMMQFAATAGSAASAAEAEEADYQAELARQMKAMAVTSAAAPAHASSLAPEAAAPVRLAGPGSALNSARGSVVMTSAAAPVQPPKPAPAAAALVTGDRELDAVLAGATLDIEKRMAAIARKLNEY